MDRMENEKIRRMHGEMYKHTDAQPEIQTAG
jgi:hypothetical protein